MIFKRSVTLEKGQLDIAPLIDVIFLLLIFFMLTSSFIFQPGIKVDLPNALTSEVISKENLIFYITSDDKIIVNERELDEEEILSMLGIARDQDRSVLIKCDRKASMGIVVHIWDFCRQEGIKRINIATTREGK